MSSDQSFAVHHRYCAGADCCCRSDGCTALIYAEGAFALPLALIVTSPAKSFCQFC